MKLLISYYDESGQPCDADKAVKGEANEYDESGGFIASHLFRVLPDKENPTEDSPGS